ncbi:MAG: NAD(+) synthase [Candidatus Thorarchaeota archaeon]
MKYKLLTDYKSIYETAISSLTQYVLENKSIKSFIIGISGGIDSAITAAIAKEVPNIEVIGRYLPILPTNTNEADRATQIGLYFCDHFEIFSLEKAFLKLIQNIEIKSTKDVFSQKVRLGNIRARLRMIQLYHLAHRYNGIVLSTDNLTEYFLGFWTINGDVGDYGPIQNLWKTEVYGIGDYLFKKYLDLKKSWAIYDCVNAVPTDGLGITDSDLDQIGTESYAEADNILIDYLNGHIMNETHPVIKRHNNTHFKRNIPINIPREIFEKASKS